MDTHPFLVIIFSLSMVNMDLEGPEGDEPDYHPEELEGHEQIWAFLRPGQARA
jgi:hypothetical protein